jgi:hypothetical protein
VTRYGPLVDLATGTESVSYAPCLGGEAVSGGGFAFVNSFPSGTNFKLQVDRPSITLEEPGEPTVFPEPANGGKATGWAVAFENNTGSTFDFRAYVQCASP